LHPTAYSHETCSGSHILKHLDPGVYGRAHKECVTIIVQELFSEITINSCKGINLKLYIQEKSESKMQDGLSDQCAKFTKQRSVTEN
jgi:hypothetical protein